MFQCPWPQTHAYVHGEAYTNTHRWFMHAVERWQADTIQWRNRFSGMQNILMVEDKLSGGKHRVLGDKHPLRLSPGGSHLTLCLTYQMIRMLIAKMSIYFLFIKTVEHPFWGACCHWCFILRLYIFLTCVLLFFLYIFAYYQPCITCIYNTYVGLSGNSVNDMVKVKSSKMSYNTKIIPE